LSLELADELTKRRFKVLRASPMWGLKSWLGTEEEFVARTTRKEEGQQIDKPVAGTTGRRRARTSIGSMAPAKTGLSLEARPPQRNVQEELSTGSTQV